MKIEEYPNVRCASSCGREDIQFLDVRSDPFRVYGLYNYREEPTFCRLNRDVAKATNPGVVELNNHTAGGRVRFATDAGVILIRCTMPGVGHMSHMPLSGSGGFDLYVHSDDGHDTFRGVYMPPFDMTNGYEALSWGMGDGKIHTYTIHFPLYNGVNTLEIGLPRGSELLPGADYEPIAPVVYYGSSITQGGCASRPGSCYQNIISAHNNIDHINLGFSGSGRAEDAICHYMAGLNMSVFVMDYDHNAPSPDYLNATHAKLYHIVREANPDLPIIMVSKPDAKVYNDDVMRRSVIYQTYIDAWKAGDRNVSFVDGFTFFEPDYHDLCTVDGCHPNDAGFLGMARVIGYEVNRVLRKTMW